MSLEIAIAENTSALKALFALLSAGTGKQMSAAEYLATLPAAHKPAAKAEPKPAATPVAAATSNATSAPAAASPSEPITYDEVKKLIIEISKSKGRDAAAGALKAFGVAKGPDLKPEQYGAFAEHAQAVLADGVAA